MPTANSPAGPAETTVPVAQPTARPAPSSATPSAPVHADPMAKSFSDLDKLASKGTPPAKEPKKAVASPEPKPEPVKNPSLDKSEPSADAKATGDVTDTDKSDASKQLAASLPQPKAKKPSDEFNAAKPLREAYDRLKEEHEKTVSELQSFKSKNGDDAGTKALHEKVESYEKRINDYEQALKHVAYEKSSEFRDKYDAPYKQAFYKSMSDMKSAVKLDGTPITEEEIQSLLLSPIKKSYAAIDEMFDGPDKRLVQRHVEKVQELNEARMDALHKARETSAEREKEFLAEKSKRDEQAKEQESKNRELWEKTNTQVVEEFPDFFKPDEKDDEGNGYLKAGYALVDLAFSKESKLSPRERMRVQAELRHRSAAFGRQVHRTQMLESKVKELEEKLAEYQESEPRNGDTRVEPGDKSDPLNWEKALESRAGK